MSSHYLASLNRIVCEMVDIHHCEPRVPWHDPIGNMSFGSIGCWNSLAMGGLHEQPFAGEALQAVQAVDHMGHKN
jgi:hypothetical protein